MIEEEFDWRELTDEQLQRALASNKIAQAKAKQEATELKREFLRRHGSTVGTNITLAGVEVGLGPNNRFDARKAGEVLTPAELKQITVDKIDTDLAREHLDPERYQECVKASDTPKIHVTLAPGKG